MEFGTARHLPCQATSEHTDSSTFNFKRFLLISLFISLFLFILFCFCFEVSILFLQSLEHGWWLHQDLQFWWDGAELCNADTPNSRELPRQAAMSRLRRFSRFVSLLNYKLNNGYVLSFFMCLSFLSSLFVLFVFEAFWSTSSTLPFCLEEYAITETFRGAISEWYAGESRESDPAANLEGLWIVPKEKKRHNMLQLK